MLRHTRTGDMGVSRTGQYRVGYDEGAPLPLFLLDRVTIERLKPARIRWRPQLGDEPQYVSVNDSRNSWKADLVEPMVTGPSSGPFLIFGEHRPEMRACFGNVPLTNHFEAELEV